MVTKTSGTRRSCCSHPSHGKKRVFNFEVKIDEIPGINLAVILAETWAKLIRDVGWVWVKTLRVWKCNSQLKKVIAREDFPPMPEPAWTEARNVQWMLLTNFSSMKVEQCWKMVMQLGSISLMGILVSQQSKFFSLLRAPKERDIGMMNLSEVLMQSVWSLREGAEMVSPTVKCPTSV